jgi:hypothetical protein
MLSVLTGLAGIPSGIGIWISFFDPIMARQLAGCRCLLQAIDFMATYYCTHSRIACVDRARTNLGTV